MIFCIYISDSHLNSFYMFLFISCIFLALVLRKKCFLQKNHKQIVYGLITPPVGLEPTTLRLTAECSTD